MSWLGRRVRCPRGTEDAGAEADMPGKLYMICVYIVYIFSLVQCTDHDCKEGAAAGGASVTVVSLVADPLLFELEHCMPGL